MKVIPICNTVESGNLPVTGGCSAAAGMPRLSDVNAGSGYVQLTSDVSEKNSVRNKIERWPTFL